MATVFVRYYQPGDQAQCQEISREAILGTANATFVAGLLREVTFQSAILVSAILFIFVGVPFHVCVFTVPLCGVFALYVCVYASHLMQVAKVGQEIADIPRIYMSSRDTGFWVAEVYEPLAYAYKPASKKMYQIVSEEEAASKGLPPGSRKMIVGMVAVARSTTTEQAAWIHRLAVRSNFRRKGIGSALLDHALRFCGKKGYETAELVATECQAEAASLFTKKGFTTKQLYHRQVFGSLVTVLVYLLSCNTRLICP